MAGRYRCDATLGSNATGRDVGLFRPGNRHVDRAPGGEGGTSSPGIDEHPTMGLIGPGLRPASAAIYRRDVADFLRWWGPRPEEATSADIIRYLAERATSPASADRRLAALAHFYQAMIYTGAGVSDPTVGIPRARRGAWR